MTPSDAELLKTFKVFTRFCGLLRVPTKNPERPYVHMHVGQWFDEQWKFWEARSGWDIILKPRQIGATTMELMRDLWFAINNKGTQTLVVIHDAKLADSLFTQLRAMYDGLRELGYAPETRFDNRRELYFHGLNSAVRIVEAGASEESANNKGRSGTIHRLHATEVAFWRFPRETMAALLSCVPKDGQVVIESTANGAQGMFYSACIEARAGRGPYKFHFFPWWQHVEYTLPVPNGFDAEPRDKWEKKLRGFGCTDGQLVWWRRKVDDPNVGIDKALQEFPIDPISCFRASGRSYFTQDELDTIGLGVQTPLRQEWLSVLGGDRAPLKVYRSPKPGQRYVIGADVAEGVGRDKSALTVLDTYSQPVATWQSDSISPGDFGVLIAYVGRMYNDAILAPERNKDGSAVLVSIEKVAKYPSDRIYKGHDGRHGWLTNSATRPVMWDELHRHCRTVEEPTPCEDHLSEMQSLVIDEDGRPRARDKRLDDGGKDDLWTSWAIGHQAVSKSPTGNIAGKVKL